MASGMPSRRAQIWDTAAAVASVSANSALAAVARSTKSRIASTRASSSRDSARAVSGSAIGGTPRTASPATPSASRLLARIVTSGPPRSTASARLAQASSRCSQPSKMSSARRPRRWSTSVSRSGRPASSRTSSARPRTAATCSGSAIEPNSRSQTPSGHRPWSAAPTSSARRVLPLPPGPVSVSSRLVSMRRLASSIRRSRPMNVVSCRGRLPGPIARDRRAGNAAGKSGTTT